MKLLGPIGELIGQLVVGFKKELARWLGRRDYWHRCRTVFQRERDSQGTTAFAALQVGLPKRERYFLDVQIVPEKATKGSNYKRFLKDLLRQRDGFHHALLCSAGGTGKTTTLVRIWELCCRYLGYPPTIYVPLRECTVGILDWIATKYQIAKEDLTAIRRKVPRFLILLDGLDDLATPGAHREILDLFRSGCLCIGALRKPLGPEDPLYPIMKHLQVYHLLMPSGHIDRYCHRFGLTLPDEMRRLLSTPMMLSLYANTYTRASGWSSQIPEDLKFRGGEKHQSLVTAGEIMWNYCRAQLVGLSGDDLRRKELTIDRILPAIAHYMSDHGKKTVTCGEVEEIIGDSYGQLSMGRQHDREYVVSGKVGLLREENRGLAFAFIHDDFRDFFAAVHLINEIEVAIQDKQYRTCPMKEPPDPVLQFFVGTVDPCHLQKLADVTGAIQSLATVEVVRGDLYCYKASKGFNSRLAEPILREDRGKLLQQALKHYRNASDMKDPWGDWNQGIVYRFMWEDARSRGDQQGMADYGALALQCTEAACEKGFPYGYNQMGVLYEQGIGVPIDLDKAACWFKKGIDSKVAHSYNRLGRIYESLARCAALCGKTDVAWDYYTDSFSIFYRQALEVREEYAMNRITWYYFDGFENLGKFDDGRIHKLMDPMFKRLRHSPKNEMRRLLEMAANAQNPYAVKRYDRIRQKDAESSRTPQEETRG